MSLVVKCIGRDRRVRRNVQSTPANGFLNRCDVDFLHRHHRLEGAFGFVAARTQGIGQDLGRDLPRNTPFVLAPAARAFLSAIADDGVPVFVGLHLIFGGDLEGESLIVLELGATIEADAGDAENSELTSSGSPFLPPGKSLGAWCTAPIVLSGKVLL